MAKELQLRETEEGQNQKMETADVLLARTRTLPKCFQEFASGCSN